jgi:peptidoglycan/LPS O-acetylase OafA/YrhL
MTATSNPAIEPFSSNFSGRIPELDGLRGIAIGTVLLWHYFVLLTVATPATPLSYALVMGRLTWSGVDLFFVLSGFLIGGILLDARTSTNYFKIFYRRRFFRIVPIYAAFLLLFPALEFTVQRTHYGNFSWLTTDAMPWYSYWTFTQNIWMAHNVKLGANALAITWSLAIEEQFYLTLPFIVRFFSGQRLVVLVIMGICLAPLARATIYLFSPHSWVVGFVLMPCRADALLLGVLTAILLRDEVCRIWIQRDKLCFRILLPALFLGIVWLNLKSASMDSPVMQTIGHTWLALFYVVVLLYSVTRPHSLLSYVLRIKWLGWLGAIAYGTYLLHQMIMGLFFGYFWRHEPRITGGGTVLTSLAALFLTLVIARLSWKYFELPLIRFGHRSNYTFVKPGSSESPQTARELIL